jgi:membrane protein DedA with SNARE-associated domain
MPPEVNLFIANYGYLAIFILVFSQEIGIPNPVPNELVLMYAGYLSLKGILYLPFIILTAISADCIGTSLLYTTFYFFGSYILRHKPKWLPFSQRVIDRLTTRISAKGLWAIRIGRLTPFIRGYTSVIAGLLQIKPKTFLPIALISATIWSSVCIITGRIIGPYWSEVGSKFGNLKLIILTAVLLILIVFVVRYFRNRKLNKNEI